jgi:hypothetical protein
MDQRQLSDQIASVSGVQLDKIRAWLEVEQAGRDEQRAERERKQARWQIVQGCAAVATIVAVIASAIVIFQGFENLKQQQAAAVQQQQAAAQQDQESRYSSVSQLSLDLDKTIADHPRLITCFQYTDCNAQPALTAQEMKQARALANYIVDFYQYLYDQLENLG